MEITVKMKISDKEAKDYFGFNFSINEFKDFGNIFASKINGPLDKKLKCISSDHKGGSFYIELVSE